MLPIVCYVEGYAQWNVIKYRRYTRSKRIRLINLHRIALSILCVSWANNLHTKKTIKCLQHNRNETAAVLSILIAQKLHLLNEIKQIQLSDS
jgi:hypothetical protein